MSHFIKNIGGAKMLEGDKNNTNEIKILKHIGSRLSELDKPTNSTLEKEKQNSARSELKMILEIFQKEAR
jgi:hypothetical protein